MNTVLRIPLVPPVRLALCMGSRHSAIERLLCLPVGMLLAVSAGVAGEAVLGLTMKPKKEVYLPFEPVVFEFVVRNQGDEPLIELLRGVRAEGGPDVGWRCLQAKASGGSFSIGRDARRVERRKPVVLKIAPGEEYKVTVPVSSPLNLAPTYWHPPHVRVPQNAKRWPRFYAGDWVVHAKARGVVPRAKMKVEVPEGVDAEAMRWIEKSFPPVLETKEGVDVDKQRYAGLCRELLERFPKSAYAKYAEYSLLLLKYPHGARVSELGFQPLYVFFGRYPEFPLAFPLLSQVLGRDVWGEHDALQPSEREFLAKLERLHPGAEAANAARRMVAVDARARAFFGERAEDWQATYLLEVRLRKSDFREFEPVTVDLQITNIAKQARMTSGSGGATFSVHLALPDGKVIRFSEDDLSSFRAFSSTGPPVPWAPGESFYGRHPLSAMFNVRSDALLAKYPVASPGTYYVSARTSWNFPFKTNEVKFVVHPDEGGAGTDSQWIRDHLAPLLRGPKYLAGDSWREYVGKCSELLEKFPDSPYALYAAGVVELHRVQTMLHPPRVAGKRRPKRQIPDLADLKKFADTYPEYPFLDRLMQIYTERGSNYADDHDFERDKQHQFLVKLAEEHTSSTARRSAAAYVAKVRAKHRRHVAIRQASREQKLARLRALPFPERLKQLPLRAEDSTYPKIIASLAEQLNCRIVGDLPDKRWAYSADLKATRVLRNIAANCEMRYVIKGEQIEFLPLEGK